MKEWTSDTVEERFWKYAGKAGPDECWNWNGATMCPNPNVIVPVRRPTLYVGKNDDSGLSQFEYAYRVSYWIHKGELPKGKQVLHSCNNALCVNPNHLYAGTPKDNIRDMIAAGNGRWQRYPPPPPVLRERLAQKITRGDAIALRETYAKGNHTLKELGEEYGISESMACRIVKGNRHIGPAQKVIALRRGRKAGRNHETLER